MKDQILQHPDAVISYPSPGMKKPDPANPPRVTAVCAADANHQVVSVEGGRPLYRREPCPTCPWRLDQVGTFPAEAFRLSAHVAYDMSDRVFGCHESGASKPATCAGFLLQSSAHNLTVRLHRMTGKIKDDVDVGDTPLHSSYRAMAIANGVDPADPILAACRDI